MKTKISVIAIGLLMLSACNSKEQKTATETAPPVANNEKYILKASNSQFVSLTPNNALVPNQVDPSKAVVFERIDLGNGKYSLKASNGKFVCDDRAQKSILRADRNSNGEWEMFEIIALDETRVNLKASSGMFVSSDRTKGDTLIADRPSAGDWEVFDMQKQN